MTGDRSRISDVSIGAALFAGNLLILGPWLLLDLPAQPWNNGYIYVAIAKMFREQSWGWNPLQYAGAPFRYLYPPLFQLIVGGVPFVSPGHAFHLVAGMAYALTPVALYVLCRSLFEGRLIPAFAAIAYSVFPSLLYVIADIRGLVAPAWYRPYGFFTMVGYDEAGHGFGLPVVMLAIAAMQRNRWMTASLLAAIVILANWTALVGLALILCALALARTRDLGLMKAVSRIFTVAGSAYGLAAFWMTPGFFVSSSLLNRVVLRHSVATESFGVDAALVLTMAAILAALSLRVSRVPLRLAMAWVAVTGGVTLVSLTGFFLAPMPNRYLLELNAGLILLTAALLSLAPREYQRRIVTAVLLAASPAGLMFLSHAWRLQPLPEDPKQQPAYRIATWLKQHDGTARVFVAGELENTLAAWSDIPQIGGPGQGVSNPLMLAAKQQIQSGCGAESPRVAQLWLRALGVRYAIVHGAAAREHYHWFAGPDKFSALPAVWDDGEGDTIYRVFGPDSQEAAVVDLDEMRGLPALTSTNDVRFLEAYVHWAAGKRSVDIRWSGADAAHIAAGLGANEAILVRINNDAGWKASGANTQSDPIGFLLLRSQPGVNSIELRFGPAWDVWLGRAITALTVLALVWRRKNQTWIAAAAVIPAVTAFGILMARLPSTMPVAEEAFVRIKPALINPAGIVDHDTLQLPPLKHGNAIDVFVANSGGPGDAVIVRVGEEPAKILLRYGPLIRFRMPDDAPSKAVVSVEVNGCRGNEFMVDIR